MNAKHPDLKTQTLKIEWTPETDEVMDRLEAFRNRKGLQRAAAARMLLKGALDAEERGKP